jgi:hypothetical protein
MPPLTLTVLASVLQMHGAGTTITSDNKGIEDLLAPIRGQLQEDRGTSAPVVVATQHLKGFYVKTYTRGNYTKTTTWTNRPTSQGGNVAPNSGNRMYEKAGPVSPPTSGGGNVAPNLGGKGR